MIPYEWVTQSAGRIRPHIRITPITHDKDENLYLKWENHQVTGSFKVRGALNKILTLDPKVLNKGLVAASAGNHGQGVALAGNMVGANVTIFCSENAVPTKVNAMKSLGANVKMIRGGYAEAETAGKKYTQYHQACWVSPYNDEQVIAGQATLGLEILDNLPVKTDAVWCVPVGGGGLISGIGIALRYNHPNSKLIGVQSAASPFFYSIFHHSTQKNVIEGPSLADGLAGSVDSESITIPLIKELVDDIILVSETEIRNAIHYAWTKYEEMIEGSAAVSLAAVLTGKIKKRPVVVILSGGNIQPELHAEIVGNVINQE